MTKLPYKPFSNFSRLEAVTAAASSRIVRLETELAWYKSALTQKGLWARKLQAELEVLDCRYQRLRILLLFIVLAGLAGATALALGRL